MGKEVKIHGNRVYLNIPEREESKIHIPENLKEESDREYVAKLDRLTVYAVGDSVTAFKAGDQVFVDAQALKRAVLVPIAGKNRLVVPSFDIFHTWL